MSSGVEMRLQASQPGSDGASAPFVVELYDGDELISRYEFLAHDEAVTVAIKELHDAAPPSA